MNRTLLDYLAKFVDKDQQNWDNILPLALMSYRASIHNSTKFTPALLTLGREIRLPIDLWRPQVPSDVNLSLPSYLQQKLDFMRDVQTVARINLKLSAESMKVHYDERANPISFNIGQQVWLYNPIRKVGKSPKLQCDWDGPYSVQRKLSDLIYEIRRDNCRSKVVHLDCLAPYESHD
ncbi:uncharacterized protein LOC131426233 [Malaya genurostris]|uniref:uncharacterized protein LOC131426233 n=1 Tax=Malaya genurostris TaxID=325434 RepID=UPI0026F3E110|nr:uncharacterized protein LOC131426233 [Malaya genurostris]